MEISVYENGKQNVLFTNDYSPNHAMINEFQTIFFLLKLKRIEIITEDLQGYCVDEEAQFIKLHISIQNLTNEILSMYHEDFSIIFDKEGPFPAEEYFHVEKQFPNEYALKPNEEIHGCLVFIIARSTQKICFQYTEYFDDESEGKTYRLKYKIQ